MKIKKGDVFWVKLNRGPETSEIAHPHVIIQESVLDQFGKETVIVCGITTNMKKLNWPGNITLDIGEANLTKKSIIDISQVNTIEIKQLGEFIGNLTEIRMEQIYSGIRLLQVFLGNRP